MSRRKKEGTKKAQAELVAARTKEAEGEELNVEETEILAKNAK